MTARVDVVIVTHNTRELTLACVRSVLAERGDWLELSCTVVDNASTDGTEEALAARAPDARVIRNDDNRGYGAACNQGLRGGDGRYVLILNSDIVVTPGAIRRLIGFLEESPGHVAAGGRQVHPGTDTVQVGHAVRRFPRLLAQLMQMAGFERHWPTNPISRRYLMLDADYESTHDVDQPAGSCLAVRREAFDALGGFDERYFYWYEDVDLAFRLWRIGRIAYVHDASFEHVGSATFAGWDKPAALLSWYPGLFRYFDTHRPRAEAIVLRLCGALFALIRLPVAAVRGDRARARALARVITIAFSPRLGAPR